MLKSILSKTIKVILEKTVQSKLEHAKTEIQVIETTDNKRYLLTCTEVTSINDNIDLSQNFEKVTSTKTGKPSLVVSQVGSRFASESIDDFLSMTLSINVNAKSYELIKNRQEKSKQTKVVKQSSKPADTIDKETLKAALKSLSKKELLEMIAGN